jgi:hypothetical protein
VVKSLEEWNEDRREGDRLRSGDAYVCALDGLGLAFRGAVSTGGIVLVGFVRWRA